MKLAAYMSDFLPHKPTTCIELVHRQEMTSKFAMNSSRKLIVEALSLHGKLQGLETNLDAQRNQPVLCVFCGILGGISMASLSTLNFPTFLTLNLHFIQH